LQKIAVNRKTLHQIKKIEKNRKKIEKNRKTHIDLATNAVIHNLRRCPVPWTTSLEEFRVSREMIKIALKNHPALSRPFGNVAEGLQLLWRGTARL
jgi:hypothetical protein